MTARGKGPLVCHFEGGLGQRLAVQLSKLGGFVCFFILDDTDDPLESLLKHY